MVGRADHLDALHGLLAGGSGAVALIGGEAGIGKSRLVRELLGTLDEEADGKEVDIKSQYGNDVFHGTNKSGWLNADGFGHTTTSVDALGSVFPSP